MADRFLRHAKIEHLQEKAGVTTEDIAQLWEQGLCLQIVNMHEHCDRNVVFQNMCKSDPTFAIVTYDYGEKELRVPIHNLWKP